MSKPVCNRYQRWGIKWVSHCKLDGERSYFMGEPTRGMSLLFRTRTQARAYRDEKWGYIKTRKDLRAEPYGWRLPQVIKVNVTIREAP